MEQLPEVLRSRREELGLTQAHLASRLGVSQPTIHRWETGENEPNGRALARLMKLLRLTLDEVS